MTVLLIVVIGISTLIWLSVYGYLTALWMIAARRHRIDQEITDFPDIAIVIPTLNEEDLILPKLEDLKNSDYPEICKSVIVVDGGSTDKTIELVKQEIERGENIRLLSTEASKGKFDQISHAFDTIKQDVVVVTDADSFLDASCIKELVSLLVRNPNIAVAGATIRPDSSLLEERIHWKFLNYLWWLEGEALSAASISGVCYACRPKKISLPDRDIKAEDIHLAFMAASRGYSVRNCRKAYATETRVPQTAAEFIQFRRRRGGGYVSELLRSNRSSHAPLGFRLMRLIRLWHFRVLPRIGIGLALLSIALLFTPYRLWLIPVFIGFAAPALISLFRSNIVSAEKLRWLKLSWAAGRLVILTIISMLGLYFHPTAQGAIGGRT